jgi:hypothetical protein
VAAQHAICMFQRMTICQLTKYQTHKQADVEYGDLEKHTILDWADGTTLDLEGCDIDETLFLHKGLSLCLDDWTKNTSEYSDFWDSL